LRSPLPGWIFAEMRAANLTQSSAEIHVRVGVAADLDALLALETKVFAIDRMSRRSLRHFLSTTTAMVIVAEYQGRIAGSAVILLRPNSSIARLYSIAVAPHRSGQGIGPSLLSAAEEAALAHDRLYLRLEVHENNHRAIARYRKAGYREFGRHERYYEDKGHALRFEKLLTPFVSGLKDSPPYFRQSTGFTCGPACIMMALAWADRSFRPLPVCEFQLWREATAMFMPSGPGGCEPYGLAVTLRHHGLSPQIHVSRRGACVLESVQSEVKRRVMRATQNNFRRESETLEIAAPPTSARDSALETLLTNAFDTGAAAIVLVSGPHGTQMGSPHWVFAFGHEGRYVLLHDPVSVSDDQGVALTPETYAVPWLAFARMTRYGPHKMTAAVLVRKGGPS
jgi:ribosomal protein S18 acetylase RimI-like enzyme